LAVSYGISYLLTIILVGGVLALLGALQESKY